MKITTAFNEREICIMLAAAAAIGIISIFCAFELAGIAGCGKLRNILASAAMIFIAISSMACTIIANRPDPDLYNWKD
jgi:hypothetical protein